MRPRAALGGVSVEYVLMGAAAWVGASLLAGAGWALFHIDVRAREERARAITARREQPVSASADASELGGTSTRQIA